MSLLTLMTQPLTIQTVGTSGLDVYGDAVTADFGTPVAAFGYLELRSSTEFLVDRTSAVTKWVAWLFPEAVIGHNDYLNFGAQKFQVDGEPWQVFSPRTRAVHHIECHLIFVTGG